MISVKYIAMYLSMIKIYPARGWKHRILEVLESMMGPVTVLPDCLGCSVTVEPEPGGMICYTEQWRTRESLERHLRSNLYDRLLEAIEHSGQPPEVAFYEVYAAQGLELVEKVRAPLLKCEKQATEDLAEGPRKSGDGPENLPGGQL